MNHFLSTESQLILAALVFYFYETSILIFENEALLSYSGKNNWIVKSARNGLSFGGKYLFIPNFFMLHRPIYRLNWDLIDLNLDLPADFEKNKLFFSDLNFVVYGSAISIFFFLPVGLFLKQNNSTLLLILCNIYLNSSIAIYLLYKNSKKLNIDSKVIRKLAIECFLCPPVTMNLIRRLSLNKPVGITSLNAAYNFSDEFSWPSLKIQLNYDVDEALNMSTNVDMDKIMISKQFILGLEKDDTN